MNTRYRIATIPKNEAPRAQTPTRHRTVGAAWRALDTIQSRLARAGSGTRLDWYVVAEENGQLRRLTEDERWAMAHAAYDADNK